MATPSWDDVHLFLALHRAGSLSAAARPLGVTQPTCGRRLAALEATLGLRLFDRTPEGLTITPAGTRLLDAALAMEAGARDLTLRASVSDRALDGVVRVATNDLFASSFLVGALPDLRARHPGLRVELVVSSGEADLLHREADLAVRFRPEGVRPTPAKLVARKLGDEPFFLYGADDYLRRRGAPADPAQLAGHELVVYTPPHPAAAWCARAFASASIVLAANSMMVTAAAIGAGVGLGVLPRRAARLHPHLRALSPAVAHGTGWLVVLPELRRVPRIRVVADAVAALFGETTG